MQLNDFFLTENTDFTPFSGQHFWVVLIAISIGSLLILWAKKQAERIQIITGNILAFSISFIVIFGSILNFFKPDFNNNNCEYFIGDDNQKELMLLHIKRKSNLNKILRDNK